jgi:hypothetical protein
MSSNLYQLREVLKSSSLRISEAIEGKGIFNTALQQPLPLALPGAPSSLPRTSEVAPRCPILLG